MAEVLYRKYRSKSFAEIVGQDHVVATLRESILKDKLSHSYLFSGPRGTGKTSIARIFAKAVNCINFNDKGDVCNICEYCQVIAANEAVDVIEMDAASNRGVDEIRNIRESVNYSPAYLKKKIYIIDEAHMLTREAFNSLLKTLEEPPQHVLFVLATTEPNKLPITILSRVQRYDFTLASEEELIAKLTKISKEEGYKLDKESASVIFHKSGGSFRDAESLLGKVLSSIKEGGKIEKDQIYEILKLVSEKDLRTFISLVLEKDVTKIRAFVDNIMKNGIDPISFVDQLLLFLKDYIYELLKESSPEYQQVYELTNALIKARREMRDYPDPKVILDIFVMGVTQNSQFPISNFQLTQEKIPNSKSQITKEEISQSKPIVSQEEINEDPKLKTQNTEPQTTNHQPQTFDAFVDVLKKELGKVNPRLRAILNNSDVKLEGSELLIHNPYKFNITFLEKTENREAILSFASKYNSEIGEIRFVVNKDIEIPNSKSQISNQENGGEVEISKPKSQNPNGVNLNQESKPKSQIKDNSDIVEKIFGN